MTRLEFFLFCAVIVLIGFYLTTIIGCAPLEDLHQVAVVARDIEPIVKVVSEIATADSPRDWFDIAQKILAGVGVIAAGIGGEAYRRKRKADKEAV